MNIFDKKNYIYFFKDESWFYFVNNWKYFKKKSKYLIFLIKNKFTFYYFHLQ